MATNFALWLRVAIVRFLMSYNDGLERKQEPQPPLPTFSETISSLSPRGYVRLHFYRSPQLCPRPSGPALRHPLVIDFHGGGFSSGLPSMDARWIASLHATSTVNPIIVSVEYSLAPEHPFPAAWQDASAAITYLATDGASKHDLDASCIVLSGFSAGGVLALTAPLWMHEQQQHETPHIPVPPLRGVLSIYPNVDFRLPRPRSPSLLTRFLNDTWDHAFTQRSPVASPFVSPDAASDSLLETALPEAIALYPVANDHLCAPCEAFGERLRRLGKNVTSHVELDADHAWDKMPVRGGRDADVGGRWAKRKEWFARMARDVDEMLR